MTEFQSVSLPATTPAFNTFGEMLRHLRRRARLTQRELGIAVGYSEAHVARLESNQRSPDPSIVSGQFIEALQLQDDAVTSQQLMRLAEAAHDAPRGQAQTPAEPQGPPTNLREQLTSFVGRMSEITDVKRLLAATRLLTITGPGGVGKTRLAVQVGTHVLPTFEHGVFIVPLASVREGADVPGAVAMALGLLREGATTDGLHGYLHDKHIMIVLDTCEHLIDACATLAVHLVQGCPQLTLLSTSREALKVPGEVTWQLPPMNCGEVMELFMARARVVRPDFELSQDEDALLAQMCGQLDGLPLAVELAASRLRVLSLAQIAARLDDRFGLLTGNNRLAQLKGQTLRTMIDWSYDLLSDGERTLLRRLSIFTADFTIELAEAVCADTAEPPLQNDGVLQRSEVLDLLTQLVNKSLVVVDEQRAAPHYSLSNTIRQYAHEKLVEADEFDDVYRRYLQYLPFVGQGMASEPVKPAKLKVTRGGRKTTRVTRKS